MLFTLAYLFLSWYKNYKESRRVMIYTKLIKNILQNNSLVIVRNAWLQKSGNIGSRLGSLLEGHHRQFKETQIWQEVDKKFLSVAPSVKVNLARWTSYLDQQKFQPHSESNLNLCYALFTFAHPEDEDVFISKVVDTPADKRVSIQDFASPIAWRPGPPFGIVAESNIENLAQLIEAFVDGYLLMDDLLELEEMAIVSVQGHAVSLLRTASNPGPLEFPPTPVSSLSLTDIRLADENEPDPRPRALSLVEELQYDQTNNSITSFGSGDILEDPDDEGAAEREGWSELGEHDPAISGCAVMMDGSSAGEALSESIEVLAPELMTPLKRSETHSSKPPNVLIYCGKKDSTRIFDSLKAVMQQCLNPDKYTIYHLSHSQVFTTPWMENTSLLITSGSKVYDDVDKAFLKFFQQGGRVFSFSRMYSCLFMPKVEPKASASVLSLNYREWKDVTVISGRHFFDDKTSLLPGVSLTTLAKDKQTDSAIIVEANHEISGGVALISQAKLDKDPVVMAISPDVFAALKKANPARFEILKDLFTRLGMDCDQGEPPALTPCSLLSAKPYLKDQLMDSVKPRLRGGLLRSKEIGLRFVSSESDIRETAIADTLPVIQNPAIQDISFDMDTYTKHLNTDSLGNVLFYTPVITSTMTLFDGLMFSVPDNVGLIAIADIQTSGKGRGGNVWISPVGCAMFSLHVRVSLSSVLGKRVAYLQHIASLAVLEAVRSKPGYQDIDLRLKWPNDIYFGSAIKLGGVIVNSSCMQDVIHANIGCGVNVSNKDPTVCVNDLIERYNLTQGTSLSAFSREELIARTVSKVQELVQLFQSDGMEAFLDLYYKRWLHGDAVVRLMSEDGPEARVVGLDDYGFLSVKTDTGKVTVQPDGNSFDIMKNLIIPKNR